MSADANPETEAREMTARICRYCRRFYWVAKGERRHACPGCAPTIMDALAALPGQPEAPPPAPTTPAAAVVPVERDGPGDLVPWPQPPPWWESECQVKRCSEPAEVNIDGWLVCIGHADDWVERLEAIETHPAMREMLPALGEW